MVDVLEGSELAFIGARDSFYIAGISATGWPYVEHCGGTVGFVCRLDERTIGWAEYGGDRYDVAVGKSVGDDRVAMMFVDYPHQGQLKVMGHIRAFDPDDRQGLASRLGVERDKARVERLVTMTVEAFDWNWPKHITPRFTQAEIDTLTAPLYARITELEAQLGGYEPFLG